MDKEEAREILAAHVARYRAKSYAELATLIGEVQVHEAAGASPPRSPSVSLPPH